jgi:hypothetical protein
VSDTGIGMTAEQQAKLFQDYSQADSLTARCDCLITTFPIPRRPIVFPDAVATADLWSFPCVSSAVIGPIPAEGLKAVWAQVASPRWWLMISGSSAISPSSGSGPV